MATGVWGFSLDVFKLLSDTLKPGVDAALPILQSAGEVALKATSPVVSDASKQAKEALQSAGVDPSPVLSAAQVPSFSFPSSSSHSLRFLIKMYALKFQTRMHYPSLLLLN